MTLLKKFIIFGLICILLGSFGLLGMYFYVKNELPSVEVLKEVRLQTPMKVYSKDGQLISQFGEKRRIPLALDDIPQQLINAFLATEDSRFYEHPGIDIVGLMRAVFGEVIGQNKGGGSTITMQVARNYFDLTRARSYIRKLKEIFISLHIEQILTKDEILTLYLNKIPLGHRSFGVGAAAQVYYGKDVSELTLAQMAIIAGLPKAPSTLNPISRPERAKNRRAVVLGRMLEMGFITKQTYQATKEAPITAKRHGAQITAPAPYVAEMVRREMVDRFGAEEAYTGGYQVYTTIIAKNQIAAQQAIINNLHDYDIRHGYRGVEKYLWQEPIMTVAPDSNTGSLQISTPEEQVANAALEPRRDDSMAWDADAIANALKYKKSYGDLQPAVVTSITEKTAYIQLKDGSYDVLDWQGMAWARPYINDSTQGEAPTRTSDIIEPGALIYVKPNSEGRLQLSQLPKPSSALVSLSPQNGAIEAIVGGYNFYLSEYNRATQAKRQVGSNIKPFLYSAALDNGYTLASVINDAPINKWDKRQGVAWRPKNSPPVYDGPTRVRRALAQSKNVVAVRLLRGTGLNQVTDHLIKFGFAPDDLPFNESLALGSAALTPLELATGIATFANGGFLIEPYLIERIEDSFNQPVYQAKPLTVCPECETYEELDDSQFPLAPRIISAENAFLIAQAMESTIWGGGSWKYKTAWMGTGWRAQALKRKDISGKTGTTNDAKDTWFSGFTPGLVTTVWTGYDDPNRSLGRTSNFKHVIDDQIVGGEAGATAALPAWIEYMKTALADLPERTIDIPKGIMSVRVDLKTGLLATKNDYTSRFEFFMQGTEPTQYVTDDRAPIVFDLDDEAKVEEEQELFY
ncbi:penicillin-binding protein 1A [Flocculibacter collagenilyticus]|uniref:penicillin-binding protein 1A n=1 Tax=Flocculibacter collagenilyticus TaxID=2744479 RepID=UPI0018F5CB4B|nr:penicillin-binding protein 1A [Flocculibacter collagenilyticus]